MPSEEPLKRNFLRKRLSRKILLLPQENLICKKGVVKLLPIEIGVKKDQIAQ
jgi:hypothetical protein